MSFLDWTIIALYLLAMLTLALWLGRGQQSRRDYYLAGGRLPPWTLATSIIATQCSTNSLLGAPAFVGFVVGGGLIWLQYELAVPLAMIGLAMLFLPIHRSGVISIYAFLEHRLGRSVRLTASGCFLLFRGVATGVTVYGVGSVLSLITGLNYPLAVALLMLVTVVYDVLGGMKAVVVSDVVQMLLLLGAVVVSLMWLLPELVAGWSMLADRSAPLQWTWGADAQGAYGFWPMLIGGLFLYMAYYGCDQSQAQRLLAAHDTRALERVLLLNGLLRFPVVLAYCLLGLGLAAYAAQHTDFLGALPTLGDGSPNLNLVFPAFVTREFAPGLAGLAIVGLFAAAMSSIDSALNSLSASTLEDFIPHRPESSERRFFLLSKLLTLAWGVFAVGFSFAVEHIAPTVLEAINKIGSMANGPLLSLFVLAVFRPTTGARAALAGFAGGLVGNVLLWRLLPDLSWLWWNPAGFLLAIAVAYALAPRRHPAPDRPASMGRRLVWPLATGFLVMLALLLLLQWRSALSPSTFSIISVT